jgi:transcriptional regulator with XRE-family HTH domain
MHRLSRNVRALRRATKLTVKAAAAQAGLDVRYWQKLEAGEASVTLARIIKIANAFRVELHELFLPRSSPERERLLREAREHAAKTRKG